MRLAASFAVQTENRHCNDHGGYESKCYFGKTWSKCPVCTAERARAKMREAEDKRKAERLADWQSKLAIAAIPERFLEKSLKNFEALNDEQKRNLDFCERFAESFSGPKTGKCAIFSGAPGTGKTHLSIGIAKQIMGKYGKTALFITVQRAIRRVRNSWAKKENETETQAIDALVFPDLLILDEVGIQNGTENERNILFDVLNERYLERKSTLLLTNLSVDECQAYLGVRLIDRMREDGGEVLVFTGESHRGKQ